MKTPVHDAQAKLVSFLGEDRLQAIGLRAIETARLDDVLARVIVRVAPSYLPVFTEDRGTFAVHLLPGRPVERSPWVFLDTGEQAASFFCRDLASIPIAMWLWNRSYYADEAEDFTRTIRAIAGAVPGGRAPSEALSAEFSHEGRTWSSRDPSTDELYALADIGHPFVGVRAPRRRTPPADALAALEPILAGSKEPELLALLLAIRIAAGTALSADDVQAALAAESWRDVAVNRSGLWLASGDGLILWDAVLANLPDPAVLARTPLEPLAAHPRAYSGTDDQAPEVLVECAERLRAAGRPEASLRMVRNACHLAAWTAGRADDELLAVLADATEAAEPEGLAAAVARRTAQVAGRGP